MSIGTSVGALKRKITNKTTVQDLEKYLGGKVTLQVIFYKLFVTM